MSEIRATLADARSFCWMSDKMLISAVSYSRVAAAPNGRFHWHWDFSASAWKPLLCQLYRYLWLLAIHSLYSFNCL